MSHEQFRSCIEACYACAEACDHCATACLQEPDVQQLARCIRLDLDCADICRVAAACMGRGSELAGDICQTCAQVCNACAEECERHSQMAHCSRCAEACRRCAEECRRMAAQAGARCGERPTAAAH